MTPTCCCALSRDNHYADPVPSYKKWQTIAVETILGIRTCQSDNSSFFRRLGISLGTLLPNVSFPVFRWPFLCCQLLSIFGPVLHLKPRLRVSPFLSYVCKAKLSPMACTDAISVASSNPLFGATPPEPRLTS